MSERFYNQKRLLSAILIVRDKSFYDQFGFQEVFQSEKSMFTAENEQIFGIFRRAH